MNNAFTNLAACGTLFMNNNAALTTWGNAFQNLRMVNGNLQFTNHNVSYPAPMQNTSDLLASLQQFTLIS